MIFAHAPVIFPAVLTLMPIFTPRFYVHVALLEASLLLRVTGDLASAQGLRQWGAILSAIAVAVFLLNTVSAFVFRPQPVKGKAKVAASPSS